MLFLEIYVTQPALFDSPRHAPIASCVLLLHPAEFGCTDVHTAHNPTRQYLLPPEYLLSRGILRIKACITHSAFRLFPAGDRHLAGARITGCSWEDGAQEGGFEGESTATPSSSEVCVHMYIVYALHCTYFHPSVVRRLCARTN